ncbi:PREDICTED: probable WRKY transcription factor 50 isoform X2 [Lupinus angustifolius]|uniref:probable WRKY transcription factor 50 isoform X2 n=1 Tax=Lupinus angustifolius TaxID=3871 RepID=UPI00092F7350|nr:PREDICTED: probable WRKY transcription factor 50 isoform X2 [Lupinus angustifolius]
MDLALPYTMEHYFVNPHPNPNYDHSSNLALPSTMEASSDFILSDYLILDDIVVDNQESWSQSTESSEKANHSHVNHGLNYGATSKNNNNINDTKRSKTEMSSRIAFRTRSELEIMDDGYKWRKYGKKSVKNSPNLRNYYKCSFEGCNVKKTVERDRDDSSYVITTYDSVHNHESPFSTSYTQISSFLSSDS